MLMKKILFITPSGGGGAERMTTLYSKICHESGMNVKLVVVNKSGIRGYLLDFLPVNVPCMIINTRYRYLFFKLCQIIWTEKPDVVFVSMPQYIKFISIIKKYKLGHYKIVSRCFNMPSKTSMTAYDIYKKWLCYSDFLVSQTDEMKEEIIDSYKYPAEKIIVINNPIDKELIRKRITEKYEFDRSYVNYLAVGRIGTQKDYLTLLKAFNILYRSRKKIRLYILGNVYEQEYYNKMLEYINIANLSENVFFEGYQSNPFKYMYTADALLLSSIFEGLPNVMLEAMYLGMPIVATRCIPYIKQVVRDGKNGYTCEVGDADTFALLMEKVLTLQKQEKFVDVNHSESKIIDFFKKFEYA